MTKEERERMARVIAGHGFDKVAAQLRADATLHETIAAQERVIAELRKDAGAANELLERTDRVFISLLAGLGVRREAKYLSDDIGRHLDAALSAKRFAALDIPYADPGIEVGATTHRRAK